MDENSKFKNRFEKKLEYFSQFKAHEWNRENKEQMFLSMHTYTQVERHTFVLLSPCLLYMNHLVEIEQKLLDIRETAIIYCTFRLLAAIFFSFTSAFSTFTFFYDHGESWENQIVVGMAMNLKISREVIVNGKSFGSSVLW